MSNKLLEVINKHAPSKKKTLRATLSLCNQRSKLKNKMNQNPFRENEFTYKK